MIINTFKLLVATAAIWSKGDYSVIVGSFHCVVAPILLLYFNLFMPNGIFNLKLSIGLIHFEFKGYEVVIYDFIQILKVHSVSKQCRI